MPKSLEDSFLEPSGTKAAIQLALNSPAGLRVSWIVVEGEDDVAVYSRFMEPENTVVKTSEGGNGRQGYANVETIVTEIKTEVPVAHIFGIRDADYSLYNEKVTCPENIFLTDRRDLEMMLLESDSVRHALNEWMPDFETTLDKCLPICRYFGYLRICNEVLNLGCKFHDHLKTTRFWDFQQHTLKDNWQDSCTSIFISLSKGAGTKKDVEEFIEEKSLKKEDFHDICRGHDLLPLLSLMLVNVQVYSVEKIMQKMIQSYTQEDFAHTQLHARISQWQEHEGVSVLIIKNRMDGTTNQHK